MENNEITRKSSLPSASASNHREQRNGFYENHITTKGHSNLYYEDYLVLGPSRNGSMFSKIAYFCSSSHYDIITNENSLIMFYVLIL